MTTPTLTAVLDEIHAQFHAGVLDEATALDRMTQACKGYQITPEGIRALLLSKARPSVSRGGGKPQ